MERHTRSVRVTGASSGLGLAHAEMLADEGVGRSVVARGPEPLAEAASSLRRHAVEVVEHPADLSDESQLREVLVTHGDAVKDRMPGAAMIRPVDVAELIRPSLHLSAVYHVGELTLDRPAA